MIYGYARVSTAGQNLQRQTINILRRYPDAKLYQEKFTGTTQDRKEWQKLLKKVKAGDTICFDAVSRMSRDAESGFKTYQELFDRGVELDFIKEPYISTSVFRSAIEKTVNVRIETGNEERDDCMNAILENLYKLQMITAKEQIKIAFQAAQDENDLRKQAIKEGMAAAKERGATFGRETGRKYETKKSLAMKKNILEMSRDFGGDKTDAWIIENMNVSKNSFYRYKKELREELEANASNTN